MVVVVVLVWSLGGKKAASSSSFGGLLRSGTPVWLYEDFKVNRPAGARESAAVLHYRYLCRWRRRGEEPQPRRDPDQDKRPVSGR